MDIIRNLYLHKYSHKMFYKTKSTSRQTNESTTVTAQNDGLRSQQFYIYSIDGRTGSPNIPAVHLDLPPKYEDVIKDPPSYVRREVS